jgi:hypothetical protein
MAKTAGVSGAGMGWVETALVAMKGLYIHCGYIVNRYWTSLPYDKQKEPTTATADPCGMTMQKTLDGGGLGGGGFDGLGHAGEEFGGAGLAVGEGFAELAGGEEGVGHLADDAEVHLVLDLVADESAVNVYAVLVGAGHGVEAVAVVPEGEGAAELEVAEVFIPGELCDFELPRDADGRVREGFEADGHAGSFAGGDAFEAQGWVFGDGARWRRGEGGLFDADTLPARHEAGKVLGVGEEGEDDLDGVREPLDGLEVVAHLLEL